VVPFESTTSWPLALQLEPDIGTHAPLVQVKPFAQSVATVQVVLHVFVAALHAKLPGHAAGIPVVQSPLPSQVLLVSWAALHTLPQLTVVPG
jgi:hypothetical protein